MSDTYQEALKLLRELHPFAQPKDGERIAIVAAYLPPTAEHEQNLALRRLVEDYLDSHNADCLCPLCDRARAALGVTMKRLPLFELVA